MRKNVLQLFHKSNVCFLLFIALVPPNGCTLNFLSLSARVLPLSWHYTHTKLGHSMQITSVGRLVPSRQRRIASSLSGVPFLISEYSKPIMASIKHWPPTQPLTKSKSRIKISLGVVYGGGGWGGGRGKIANGSELLWLRSVIYAR